MLKDRTYKILTTSEVRLLHMAEKRWHEIANFIHHHVISWPPLFIYGYLPHLPTSDHLLASFSITFSLWLSSPKPFGGTGESA